MPILHRDRVDYLLSDVKDLKMKQQKSIAPEMLGRATGAKATPRARGIINFAQEEMH